MPASVAATPPDGLPALDDVAGQLAVEIAAAAGVREHRDLVAAAPQLAAQRQGREHVPAGAAGGDQQRPPHTVSSTRALRRVRASSMPAAMASAMNEEPP